MTEDEFIQLEPVHIKTASKIMASITTERKMELRLSSSYALSIKRGWPSPGQMPPISFLPSGASRRFLADRWNANAYRPKVQQRWSFVGSALHLQPFSMM